MVRWVYKFRKVDIKDHLKHLDDKFHVAEARFDESQKKLRGKLREESTTEEVDAILRPEDFEEVEEELEGGGLQKSESLLL